MTAITAQLSLAENRRIMQSGGFCAMCVAPREVKIVNGVTCIVCTRCKDCVEVNAQ